MKNLALKSSKLLHTQITKSHKETEKYGEKHTYLQIPKPPRQHKKMSPFAIDQSYLPPTSSTTATTVITQRQRTQSYGNKLKPVPAQIKSKRKLLQFPCTNKWCSERRIGNASLFLSLFCAKVKQRRWREKESSGEQERERETSKRFSFCFLCFLFLFSWANYKTIFSKNYSCCW